MRLNRFFALLIGFVLMAAPTGLQAAPYASGVQVDGTTVNFILNAPTDMLSYSINGGAPVALDGSTKGQKSFSLTSPSDTFSIVAEHNSAVGYTIPTGGVIPAKPDVRGWTQPSDEAGYFLLSDDDDPLTRFQNPRGVGISRDPNAPNFGTVYIAHSTPTTPEQAAALGRDLGRGLYALRADGSDAFGFGDEAQNPTNVDGFPAFTDVSANSPYRVFVAASGDVYVADWSDANGNVFHITPTLSEARNLLEGFESPFPLPAGQNHGSIPSAFVEGSLADNNLVLYTIDEDLNSAHFGGEEEDDRNSVWRYEIGGTAPSNVTPTKIASGLTGTASRLASLDIGADGKIYMSQWRTQIGGETEPSIVVADADGTILFDSLQVSRDLLGDPEAVDIPVQIFSVKVSPDQRWMALMINRSDVGIIPLVDGIPDLANRMIVNSSFDDDDVFTGRDIAFDAAGNIHYVSSGQTRYRVLGPGGHTIATTSWDGTEFGFDIQTLTVVALPGDFNNDGVVDAADYTVWRDGLGTEFEMEHYDEWKGNFGATSSGSAAATTAAVPEPGTLMMALVGVAAAGWHRRRRSLA